jgi:hypothetical protein
MIFNLNYRSLARESVLLKTTFILLSLPILFFFVAAFSSCKKFVEVDAPVTSLSGGNVYNGDGTAISVVTGLYNNLSGSASSAILSGTPNFPMLSLYAGLSADELSLWSGISNLQQIAYYKNDHSATIGGDEIWTFTYPQIFSCNSAIMGLDKSKVLTPSVKLQLMGEVKFMRAFYYFYLVNLYGDVPLVLTTDYSLNVKLARAAKIDVYKQIISDLIDAQSLLSQNYLDGNLTTSTAEKIRPTKWAATALLARTYLFSGDYANAELQATSIINQSAYGLGSLDNIFLKNSIEAIWQLQPVISGWNTLDARAFILAPSGLSTQKPVFLSAYLLNDFESGDNRKIKWINSYTDVSGTYYYSYKYKSATLNAPLTEYLTVFRLSEQYLIRAEAEANGIGGGINAAITDLNKIRNRAGLANYSGLKDKGSVLDAILHERRVELFTEWGHRWLDLKRTNKVDAVMSVVTPSKGGTWQPTDQLYPIGQFEIQKNPSLTQNPGY